MIKSINYRANQIASIEISDASDVQSLGDSYGYGSTARVTGQIGDEYIYTPQGWIKISSGVTEVVANPELEGDEDSLTGLQVGDTKYKVGGSSGGGALVVNLSENYVCDKTAGEMLAAMETVGVVIKIAFPDDTTIMPVIAGYGKSSGFGFGVETDDGILHFTAETENGYPVLQSDGRE